MPDTANPPTANGAGRVCCVVIEVWLEVIARWKRGSKRPCWTAFRHAERCGAATNLHSQEWFGGRSQPRSTPLADHPSPSQARDRYARGHPGLWLNAPQPVGKGRDLALTILFDVLLTNPTDRDGATSAVGQG